MNYSVVFQKRKASWFMQFITILYRSALTVLKEPMLVKVRIMQTVMVAILIGLIFYGQEYTSDGIMNINGALFLGITTSTFSNVFSVVEVFCNEIEVFFREYQGNLYSTNTYFIGKSLAELPLFILLPVIYTTIVYPMVGFRSGWIHFFHANLINILLANVATSFGYLISTLANNVTMALSIGPPLIIPFLLFGGYFLNAGSVPWYFTWLAKISWFKYGNEALLINQWHGTDVVNVTCAEILVANTSDVCTISGDLILTRLNFEPVN